jgi:hypothetical protein
VMLRTEEANLCLQLTGFSAGFSSPLCALKRTQGFLGYQLLPATEIGR